ncbi:hypothetical protein [Nannocystis punicea]|uniref:MYXO-CTERM domain-containing protein n=1 Tax=Nannocystis punicea TaxID=2995304 RepID=A0ABY7H4L0_9BACT|nr:hypothetical protein [Nannocystis poenicansa]WAS94215.1 hypothetical protein O0S08_49465 [Nannocystis poenicansa]
MRRVSPCLAAALLASACNNDVVVDCDNFYGLAHRLPEPGAIEVPTNTRLWINLPLSDFNYLDTIELVGPDGPVALTHSIVDTNWIWGDPKEHPGLDLWIFTPVEPLVPGLHEVFLAGFSDWSFTVGDAFDTKPPPIPVVEDIAYGSDREEGHAYIALKQPMSLVVLEQEGQAELDPQTLSGEITEVYTGDELFLGRGLCLDNWPGEPGARTRIRLSAFDLAGNHSGYGEWIDIEIPGGCSLAASRTPPPLLLLLALLGRRRRAPRPASDECHDS